MGGQTFAASLDPSLPANTPHSCGSWAATDTYCTHVHTINRVKQGFLLRWVILLERVLWTSAADVVTQYSHYLRAGRYTPELSSLKSHLPAAFLLANVGLLGWFEAAEGNYFQDHLTTSACRYRECKLQGADCLLKIRQLVRSHGKFGLVVLLVASILWLNAVLQFQSQLLAWFTAILEYLNV